MDKIQVTINGKEQEIDKNATIQCILDDMQVKGPMFVVEKNLQIVHKDNYNEAVSEGDRLEIVGFFGGG